ncbi:FadR family transcriptional regulator [Lachnospiraceae bacterium ZAX-1]
MKLSSKVVAKLLDMITVQKVYRLGDKLPNENELAVMFGVSRTTVREAILYLVTQNVLEIRRGKGTYVLEASGVEEDFGFDHLKFMHLKMRDLYELRMMLEPQISYYAAMRATNEEIEEILTIGKNLEDERSEKEEDALGNMHFHNAIAKATHNEFGIKLMEIINEALIKAFKVNQLKQIMYEDTMIDHQLIMEFLRLRDGEGAKQAMYLHMRHSMKDYAVK